MNSTKILPIRIVFNVTNEIERFVYIYAILGRKVYLVDAGVADVLDQIQLALQNASRDISEVQGVLLTHTHPDHIGCLSQIKKIVPRCKVYVSANEREWLENIDSQFNQRPIPNFYTLAGASVQPDVIVSPGDTIYLEESIHLNIIDCSGHSDGSVGYHWVESNTLFSGDAIPIASEIPIFSSLTRSICTIYRIQNLTNVDYIFPAWDTVKCNTEIADYLDEANDLLTGISMAITQVCQTETACFAAKDNKYYSICEKLGLSAFQDHPLFSQSIEAGIKEYYENMLRKTDKNLRKRGFDTIVCNNKSDVNIVIARIFDEMQPRIIGFGNSQTVRSCGIVELAKSTVEKIYQHDPRDFSAEDDRNALLSDIYFTSANALSEDGHIINIDGTGNRTGATCFGPRKIVYIVGRNKVMPTLETALKRSKRAAARLAAFYKRDTPCVQTGICNDCLSPEAICGVTTVHRKALAGNSITVILVNDDLGI